MTFSEITTFQKMLIELVMNNNKTIIFSKRNKGLCITICNAETKKETSNIINAIGILPDEEIMIGVLVNLNYTLNNEA